jgi:uncharacterized protein YukE
MADITVDYAALQKEAGALNQDKETITNQLTTTENRIVALTEGPFKTQVASGKFQDAHRQWNTSTKQALEALTQMATYLRNVEQQHQGLDSSLGNIG